MRQRGGVASRGECVITGGRRGIGAATARRAAAASWAVCLSWHADEESASAVAAELGGRPSAPTSPKKATCSP